MEKLVTALSSPGEKATVISEINNNKLQALVGRPFKPLKSSHWKWSARLARPFVPAADNTTTGERRIVVRFTLELPAEHTFRKIKGSAFAFGGLDGATHLPLSR